MALYSPLLESVSKLSTTRLPTASASATVTAPMTLTGTAPLAETQPKVSLGTTTLAQPNIAAPPPPTTTTPNIAAPPPPPAPTQPTIGAVPPPPAPAPSSLLAGTGSLVAPTLPSMGSPTLTGVLGAGILGASPAATLPSSTAPAPSLPGALTNALQGQAPVGGTGTFPTTLPTTRPLPEPTTGQAPVAQPNLPAMPPPMPPNPWAESEGPLQDFGPGNDLRGTQINPYTGERLRGVQDDTDVLFRALTQGPSLSQAALDQYRMFGEDQADERQQGIRSIGQAAARLGRLGSGMVTTDLGNLEERLGVADARERSRLASGLAFAEGGERRANLSAGQGFESQLYGQGQGLRNEARTERDFQEGQARRAQDMEILRRQLEVAYEQYQRQLQLQGAALYGNQASAGQDAAAQFLEAIL